MVIHLAISAKIWYILITVILYDDQIRLDDFNQTLPYIPTYIMKTIMKHTNIHSECSTEPKDNELETLWKMNMFIHVDLQDCGAVFIISLKGHF